MKTPCLDSKINELEKGILTPKGINVLKEFKAIKQLIENNPIVSTPDKPVWVVDKHNGKRILLADLGRMARFRYIVVECNHNGLFLSGKLFNWECLTDVTPYTPKVNIEVTEDEAVKVEEFLKGLRDGR
jgi:hypothetical protein